MQAHSLSMVDRRADMAMEAFIQRAVSATNKKGEFIYKEFSDFFDYEKEIEAVRNPDSDKPKENKWQKFFDYYQKGGT